MNEDMMTEAERASIAADGTDGLLGKRGKGVFHIHTLGCQMNVHDSERIAACWRPMVRACNRGPDQ